MSDLDLIRYGVPVKLKHVNSGCVLHSHNINYATGSGQQEITCFASRDDNDWWVVKGPHGDHRYNAQLGFPIKNGSVVRLEHTLTLRNLHSHSGFQSPGSHQGEATAFGSGGHGDSNDNWVLEVQGLGTGEYLRAGQTFRLIHVNTNWALHSHAGFYAATGQQEVTTYQHRDSNDFWVID